MDVKECFRKKILKKIEKNKLKVENSLKIAENKFLRSKELFNSEFFEEAFLTAYTSMFHSARAILYNDGIQEKSHFAVYIYLKEKYSDKIPKHLIESFKVYQLERHKILYGFDGKVNKSEIESLIEDAEQFLIKIKEILNN